MPWFRDSCSRHGFAGHQDDCPDCYRAEIERERREKTDKQIKEANEKRDKDDAYKQKQAYAAAQRSSRSSDSGGGLSIIVIIAVLFIGIFAAWVGMFVIPVVLIATAGLFGVEKFKPEYAPKGNWQRGYANRVLLERAAMWFTPAGVLILWGWILQWQGGNQFWVLPVIGGGVVFALGTWRSIRYMRRGAFPTVKDGQ